MNKFLAILLLAGVVVCSGNLDINQALNTSDANPLLITDIGNGYNQIKYPQFYNF